VLLFRLELSAEVNEIVVPFDSVISLSFDLLDDCTQRLDFIVHVHGACHVGLAALRLNLPLCDLLEESPVLFEEIAFFLIQFVDALLHFFHALPHVLKSNICLAPVGRIGQDLDESLWRVICTRGLI